MKYIEIFDGFKNKEELNREIKRHQIGLKIQSNLIYKL